MREDAIDPSEQTVVDLRVLRPVSRLGGDGIRKLWRLRSLFIDHDLFFRVYIYLIYLFG